MIRHFQDRPSNRCRDSLLALALAVSITAGCSPADDDEQTNAPGISADAIESHVAVLASDAFAGREPGTVGETRTLEYLEAEFREIGLEPAFDAGYRQSVGLIEVTPDFGMTLELGRQSLNFGSDFVAWTKRQVDAVELDESELVFAGYGIVAPEEDRNDYAGTDWRGKTAVVLINDPGFATEDPEVFAGREMTYYGRWTYKYEEAARQGAEGLIIIHETAPAAYGWNVVESSWSQSQFDFVRDDRNAGRVAVEGWITRPVAERLLDEAGEDLEALKEAALDPAFQPVPLGVTASIRVENELRRLSSNNLVGLLPGSTRPTEMILYMAHWDAHGTDPSLEGDTVYNGAADNATGVGSLLEIARAFAESPPGTLERSVAFAAVTAEEQGLLGSQYLAAYPPVPTANIVAVLNMDIMSREPSSSLATVIGIGQSELGDYAREAASAQDRVVRPHPSPESGYFFRSDHFSFVREGVPALLFLNPGRPDSEYVREHYHRPSDEYDPAWQLGAAAADAELFFRVGRELAAGDDFPNWLDDNQFSAVRKKDRGK